MFKLRSLPKPLFAGLLMMFSVSQPASAEIKLYQYDGKLPFAQMMLNMMVAMGVLDRIPTHGPYAGYGLHTYPGSSLSTYNNPYARALALRGIYPGSSYLRNLYGNSAYLRSLYGNNYNLNNPFIRSPWLQSPWSMSTFGNSPYTNSLWSNPNWGVLPYDSTSPYDAVNDVVDGAMWDAPIWSQSEIDGWIDEPWSDDSWETSSWNPDAYTKRPADKTQAAVNQTAPLIQNFNYGVPPDARQGAQGGRHASKPPANRSRKPSPLSKLAPPAYQPRSQQPARPGHEQSRPSPLRKRMGQNYADEYATPPKKKKSSEKRYPGPACVTEFCGLMKPDMDGLWVAQNGEMLGIKDERYLWSDGYSRYLTGHMKIQNEYLLANVDGHDTLMRFKYKLAGNHLMTLRPDGTIQEFARIPVSQLSADDFYSVPYGADRYGPDRYGDRMTGGPYDRPYNVPAYNPYAVPRGDFPGDQYDLPYFEGGNSRGINPGDNPAQAAGKDLGNAPNQAINQ